MEYSGIMWVFVLLHGSQGWLISTAFSGGLLLNQRWWSDWLLQERDRKELWTAIVPITFVNFMAVCAHFIWMHVQIPFKVIAYSRILSGPFPVRMTKEISSHNPSFTPTYPLLMLRALRAFQSSKCHSSTIKDGGELLKPTQVPNISFQFWSLLLVFVCYWLWYLKGQFTQFTHSRLVSSRANNVGHVCPVNLFRPTI